MRHGPAGFVVAFFAVAILGLFGGEFVYRVSLLLRERAQPSSYAVTFGYRWIPGPAMRPGSLVGPYPAARTFVRRSYDFVGRPALVSHVRVNGQGWVSGRDYTPAKKADEKRVAFLGDSLTASVTNDTPWTEVVERRLRDIPVLNLSVAGLGISEFPRLLGPPAKALSADLVVVNVSFESLGLGLPPGLREDWTSSALASGGDIQIPVYCPPPASTRSDCVTTAWYLERDRALSPEEVATAKRVSARGALADRLLRETRLLLLARDPIASETRTQEDREAVALSALAEIRLGFPNLLVTINPLAHYFDPQTRPQRLAGFVTRLREAGFDVVDMTTRLPTAPADVAQAWFNMPHDGHWNDAGASIYGEAMAAVVAQRLAVGRSSANPK